LTLSVRENYYSEPDPVLIYGRLFVRKSAPHYSLEEVREARGGALMPLLNLYFTAPWEPVAERRGDALGLRALTDELAEVLAPGISNRTEDLRWVTILSWCLHYSNEVWQRIQKDNLSGRRFEQERYAWFRPLELMWIARTGILTKKVWQGRQLPGQRAVATWLRAGGESERFGLSIDQFRKYRQTGIYGAYRIAFRRWPGLSRNGDGWTPGKECIDLKNFIDDQLGIASRPDTDTQIKTKTWREREHEWWLKTWSNFDRGSPVLMRRNLPRLREDSSALEEARLIRPVLFGENDQQGSEANRRRKTVKVASTSSARTHVELCDELAAQLKGESPELAVLPDFTRLADAGLELMDEIYASVGDGSPPGGITIGDIAKRVAVRDHCARLRNVAKRWSRRSQPLGSIRHLEAANRFAKSVNTRSNEECIKNLVAYHERDGGGVRWFLLRDGRVMPNALFRPGSAARYRFRLWPLCRMAVQCRQIRSMPKSLALERRPEPGLVEEVE
jgi:hypothetical protein